MAIVVEQYLSYAKVPRGADKSRWVT